MNCLQEFKLSSRVIVESELECCQMTIFLRQHYHCFFFETSTDYLPIQNELKISQNKCCCYSSLPEGKKKHYCFSQEKYCECNIDCVICCFMLDCQLTSCFLGLPQSSGFTQRLPSTFFVILINDKFLYSHLTLWVSAKSLQHLNFRHD